MGTKMILDDDETDLGAAALTPSVNFTITEILALFRDLTLL